MLLSKGLALSLRLLRAPKLPLQYCVRYFGEKPNLSEYKVKVGSRTAKVMDTNPDQSTAPVDSAPEEAQVKKMIIEGYKSSRVIKP